MTSNLAEKKVLMVLPSKDFDPTETSVPWITLTQAGIKVDFCTEDGNPGECDPLLITGVIFGQLGATPSAKQSYESMRQSTEFQNPLRYSDVDFMAYDGVILPGGHAQGMKPYLENIVIREKIIPVFKHERKIVAAVCHGTIVLARTIDPETGKSILHKKQTTTLPKHMERSAYYLTAWKLGRYYRTYPEYVEDEMKALLENPKNQLQSGPLNLLGSMSESYAYTCVDGNYISARWPGDCNMFAKTILEKISSL